MSTRDFLPPRQRGLILHTALILLLLAASVYCFSAAARQEVGPLFTLFLLAAIGTFAPVPILAYRLYALQRARYRLDRDTLVLSWGLRLEELPLGEIEWVRAATDLTSRLSLPPVRLPGSILGLRRHPDLGLVEFLASESRGMLLVASLRRVYAISPADPAGFMREFQRSVEQGSLEHARGRSVFPSSAITRAWEHPLARFLWIAGILVNLAALIWVSAIIPTRTGIRLGFSPGGVPLEPAPASSLMLLPLASIAFLVIGWLTGLFLYRRADLRSLAFILWTSSTLTGLLFLVAVWLSISSSG